MAALTADRKMLSRYTGRSFVGDVAAATVIYGGSMVAKNAAGHIVPASDTAALVVVGVAQEKVDNSAGAAAAKTVQILTGVFTFLNAGGAIVQAGKHANCYVADDQSVTTAAVAANDIVAGTVDAFTATTVDVAIGL